MHTTWCVDAGQCVERWHGVGVFAVLRRTLVPTQHLVHKLQNTHDKDNNQGFLSPLTVRVQAQSVAKHEWPDHQHYGAARQPLVQLAAASKNMTVACNMPCTSFGTAATPCSLRAMLMYLLCYAGAYLLHTYGHLQMCTSPAVMLPVHADCASPCHAVSCCAGAVPV